MKEQFDSYNTRATLLQRVCQGDEQSWVDFYETYSRLITWLCQRKGLKSEAQWQLVIQAVMCHLANTEWQHDKEKGQFRNLILKIASLKIHEVLRELKPAGAVKVEQIDQQEIDDISAEDSREQHDNEESLRHALKLMAADESISQLHMNILHLFLQGEKAEQIATETNQSLSNIYVIKHRMLKELRRLIDTD